MWASRTGRADNWPPLCKWRPTHPFRRTQMESDARHGTVAQPVVANRLCTRAVGVDPGRPGQSFTDFRATPRPITLSRLSFCGKKRTRIRPQNATAGVASPDKNDIPRERHPSRTTSGRDIPHMPVSETSCRELSRFRSPGIPLPRRRLEPRRRIGPRRRLGPRRPRVAGLFIHRV